MEIKKCQNSPAFGMKLGGVNTEKIAEYLGEEGLKATKIAINKVITKELGDEYTTAHISAIPRSPMFKKEPVAKRKPTTAKETVASTESNTEDSLSSRFSKGLLELKQLKQTIDGPKIKSIIRISKRKIRQQFTLDPQNQELVVKENNKLSIICEKLLIPDLEGNKFHAKPRNKIQQIKDRVFQLVSKKRVFHSSELTYEELTKDPATIEKLLKAKTLEALEKCNNDIETQKFFLNEDARRARKNQA